jgi:hypothetical protein
MLGKLMKYEFKATGRIFLPLFGALIIISAFNRLFIALDFTLPKIIASTMSGFMIAAIFVVAIVLTIQRFYRNLLSSEGYLMFTLPVKVDSLIWSKLLVASIWTVACLVVVFLAGLIMSATRYDLQDIANCIGEFFRLLRQAGFTDILVGIEGILLLVGMLFSSILMLYACIALSLFVNKHRIGFAFLMFIVINIIAQIIIGVVAFSVNLDSLGAQLCTMSAFGQVQAVLGGFLAYVVITGGVLYLVTRLMLKYKLNLE